VLPPGQSANVREIAGYRAEAPGQFGQRWRGGASHLGLKFGFIHIGNTDGGYLLAFTHTRFFSYLGLSFAKSVGAVTFATCILIPSLPTPPIKLLQQLAGAPDGSGPLPG
jgi:hypothetical protein